VWLNVKRVFWRIKSSDLRGENEYRAILPQVEAAGRILDRIDAADTLLGESTELIRRTDSTTRMIEHAQLKLAQQQARLAAAQDSLVAAEQLSAQCSGSLAKFCEPSQPEDFAAQCEKSLRELQLQASSLQLLHAAFIEFRAKSAELKERQVSRQNAELEAARSAEICQRLETERSAALLALTVSRQAGRALQFAVDLVAHRDLLVAGDPCPLCGSTHHDKENQLDVRSQQESLRQHESHLAALEQSLATLEKSMRAQDQAAATARERIRSLTEHEASLARRLEEIVAQFPPGTDVTQPDGGVAEVAAKLQVLAEQERELADRIKQARDLAREAQRADQSVQQLKLEAIGVQNSAEQTTIEIRSLQREFADRQEALQELATKQQSAQEAVASACLAAGIGVAGVAEIPEFRRCVLAQFGGKSPASVRAERESAAQAASELAEKARQLEQTARISAAEAAQSLRDATQHHATELSALSSAADALDSNLLQAGFANAAALIASIFSADDERAALLQLADADSLLARELGSLLESQNTLDAHRAGASALGNEEATASAESAQHLQSEAIALRSQILERRGELREKLAGAESLIARASSVREKLEAAVADSAVWEKLSGLIGKREGAAFQEFAQSVTLRELIGLANPRLERIAPRYALTSTGSEEEDSWDLEFQIVDRGQGDGVRSISTLSGGETFLVSLALALALADLRKSTLPIETLLLDEGFGSLDSDTLDVALDAIQQLSADGGTQIGIVSHVDSLRERISDQVIVEPRGGGRSTLRTLTVSG
jgi:exonuclease SbcC